MSNQKYYNMLAKHGGVGAVARFKKTWLPRKLNAFFNIPAMEPEMRRLLIEDFMQREIMLAVFEAIDPLMRRYADWILHSPSDDAYLAARHDSLKHVDIRKTEYDELFQEAPIYRWRPIVWAVQANQTELALKQYITGERKISGEADQPELLYDYEVRIPHITAMDDESVELETYRSEGLIEPGAWLVQDPQTSLDLGQDSRLMVLEMSNQDFWQLYEPVYPQWRRYRRKTLFRAVRNPFGVNVETASNLGVSYCAKDSWFLEPYDPEQPDKLFPKQRLAASWWWVDELLEPVPKKERCCALGEIMR